MCGGRDEGTTPESSFYGGQRRRCPAARQSSPCSKARQLVPSEIGKWFEFPVRQPQSAYKLPAMHLDLASSQQVDIENYNVSASRLPAPENKEIKWKNTNQPSRTLASWQST